MDAIAVDRLTKYYDGRPVVHSVSLRVEPGTIYGLLGRNGSGKSTTIKMLLGMVTPDDGGASLLGEDSAQLSPATRQRIAYLAEGNPFYHWMSINDAMRFHRPFYPTWNQGLFEQIIDHFKLPRRAKIRRLSKGQKAQVALALAAAPEPDLFILDDPTLGLDTVVRRDFLESMIQIIQREGRTILFSSHNLGDVERVADRIGIMVQGVLQVDCPTDHFKSMVRKVSLEFRGEAPDFPGCRGLIRVAPLGSRLELIVVGLDDEHRELFRDLGAIAMEETEMNLEDAFIEYTRGSRTTSPLLEGVSVYASGIDDQRVA